MHTGIFKKQLGKTRFAVYASYWAHHQAFGVFGDQQIAQTSVPFGFWVGADYAEEPVGERPSGAPSLLAVQHKPFAVSLGTGRKGCQIAACVRFRPSLRPDFFARSHRQQKPFLLFGSGELKNGGSQQAHPVGAHPAGRPRCPVFLFVEQPFHQRAISPAVFLGPSWHRPPCGKQLLLPLAMLLKAVESIHRLQRLSRQIGSQPATDFVSESQFSGSERQVHYATLSVSAA